MQTAIRRAVVSLADIPAEPVPEMEGHHNGLIWWIFQPDGRGLQSLLTEGLRVHVQQYDVGGYTKGHGFHTAVEQVYYVLKGSMEVRMGDKTYTAEEGSYVYIPRGVDHDHRNIGQDKLVFLTINSPVRAGEVAPLPTVRE